MTTDQGEKLPAELQQHLDELVAAGGKVTVMETHARDSVELDITDLDDRDREVLDRLLNDIGPGEVETGIVQAAVRILREYYPGDRVTLDKVASMGRSLLSAT
jgi:hypothetical protein